MITALATEEHPHLERKKKGLSFNVRAIASEVVNKKSGIFWFQLHLNQRFSSDLQ